MMLLKNTHKYLNIKNEVLFSVIPCGLIIKEIHAYILSLLVGVVFIMPGCVAVDIDEDPNEINDVYLNSLLGHSMEEIMQQLGNPESHFQQNNKDYLRYRTYGNVSGILFITLLPIPLGDLDTSETWCFLLEFGPENTLQDYEANHSDRDYDLECSEYSWKLLISPSAQLATHKPSEEVGIFHPGICWYATKIERTEVTDLMLEGDYFIGKKPFKIPPGQYVVSFHGCYTHRNIASFLLTVEAGHVYKLISELCLWRCTWTGKDNEMTIWIEDTTVGEIVTEVRKITL